MRTIQITATLVGLLGVTFLAGSPIKWVQDELLAYLGAPPSDHAYAAPSQERSLTNDAPLQLAKVLGRPAGKPGESPEDQEMKKLPQPVPPGEIRKASKAELLERCNNIPQCRGKLQMIKQGKRPARLLPAGKPGESPEEKEFSTISKPLPPNPGRPPRSDLRLPKGTSDLLSWMNPFAVSQAHAQTAFSVYLTPQNRYSGNPYGLLTLFGVIYWGPHYLNGTGALSLDSTQSEHKPYAYVATNVPSEGWYLINFEASRGKAKLRHQYNGPIIENWDFSSQSCGRCDYLTVEYLVAGRHNFYFWPDGSNIYFYSTSVDSY